MQTTNPLYKSIDSIQEWVRYNFLTRKLNTVFGLLFLSLIAVGLSYITVLINAKIAIAIVGAMMGVLFMILCLLYPMFGFYFTIFLSIFISMPERLMSTGMIPTGLIPEYFSYITLVGVITKQEYRKEITKSFWGHAITIWMVILLLYYLLEFFNPAMHGKLGWFNFIRKQGSLFAFFYIAYCLITDRKTVNQMVNFWIAVSLLEALYACKQQWFGLFGFETRWLLSDPIRMDLFINWGFTRKFGLMYDPANAGILYGACGTFLLILALRATNFKKQVFLYTAAIFNLLASSYTGTRTATMITVLGIVFYGVLTLYEKKTLVFMAFCTIMLVGIIVVPIYDNVVINRIKSTFEPSEDMSAVVRDINRKSVQPYIYRHPIGGGIFTSGNIGLLYNPGHYLSQIPPDSGYMQILMDQGWIGMILTLFFYFYILRTGTFYFYRVKDPELKTIYVANSVFLFCMISAQISQMAIPSYPSVFYMYTIFALQLKMHYFDKSKNEDTNVHPEPHKNE